MKSDGNKSIKICHFSDLHLPLPARVPVAMLLGKRLLGLANLKFRRSGTHKIEAFEALLEHLASENADLVIVSGDLVNLAVPFEYEQVKDLFSKYGLTPEKTVVIPGNHDRYTPGAHHRDTFEKAMKSWLPEGFSRKSGYPIIRDVGPVTLAAMDTAVWRGPVRAAGLVKKPDLNRLAELVSADNDHHLVVVTHHPPFELHGPWKRHYRNGLAGHEKLTSALANRSCTLLHGHLHNFSRRQIGKAEIIGVPSASNVTGYRKSQLSYNVYTFEKSGLTDASAVIHWPGATEEDDRFARSKLPDLALDV